MFILCKCLDALMLLKFLRFFRVNFILPLTKNVCWYGNYVLLFCFHAQLHVSVARCFIIIQSGISHFGQRGVYSFIMAASNHIVAATRELGAQSHQREIPSLSAMYIYHTNGNKQALCSGSCQALSD